MKKVALITGASSGLGKELAKIHAECGGDLVIVARSVDKLNDLKGELEQKFGVSVYVLPKDLSKADAAEEIYDELQREKISVDYLINNAGLGGQGYFHERTTSLSARAGKFSTSRRRRHFSRADLCRQSITRQNPM